MKKGLRVFVRIIAGVLFVMSLLLLFVTPLAGVAGILFSVLLVLYTIKAKKDEEKAAADYAARNPKMSGKHVIIPVVGLQYRIDSVKELLNPNDDFKHPKDKDETYYRYDEFYEPCQLVPEPENEHDPDAIAVKCYDLVVGYIPKDHQAEARDVMSGNYRIMLSIEDGDYKEYDFDDERWQIVEKPLRVRVFAVEYAKTDA